jgi:predicted ATPase
MHWADSATCDLVRFIGRRRSNLPLLWILSFRDDEISMNHPLRRVIADLPRTDTIHMPLAPLSATAIQSMVQEAGLIDELPATRLHQLTAGNPFFVSEFLAAKSNDGKPPAPLALTAESNLPLTVRDAVLGRAQNLSASARALLDLACLEPNCIEIDILARLHEVPITGLLNECVQAGVLRLSDDSSTIEFRHEIARRAIESTLSMPFRAMLHQLHAELIGEDQPTDLARTVYHAKRADVGEMVLQWAPKAAEQAARLGAHQQAADHYKSCLAFIDLVG